METVEKNKNNRGPENSRVIGGLILVGVGAALLLRNVGFFFPNWLFSWPIILILVGIYSGFKHQFRNNSWLILIGVGGFFLVNDFIPQLGLEPLFWPIVIIGAGLIFILRPRGNNWRNYKKSKDYTNWQDYTNLKTTGTTSFDATGTPVNDSFVDGNDWLDVQSIFSGVKRNIVSKNFQGGGITCIFGGSEIDLTQADINGTAVLKLEMVFGGTKLVLPANWTVQNEINGVFHGVDDKRKYNTPANPGKILILKGSAVFAGIEIRSY